MERQKCGIQITLKRNQASSTRCLCHHPLVSSFLHDGQMTKRCMIIFMAKYRTCGLVMALLQKRGRLLLWVTTITYECKCSLFCICTCTCILLYYLCCYLQRFAKCQPWWGFEFLYSSRLIGMAIQLGTMVVSLKLETRPKEVRLRYQLPLYLTEGRVFSIHTSLNNHVIYWTN